MLRRKACIKVARASRRARRALVSMRYVIDRINPIPHSEEAAQRLSRRTHRVDPAGRLRHSPIYATWYSLRKLANVATDRLDQRGAFFETAAARLPQNEELG